MVPGEAWRERKSTGCLQEAGHEAERRNRNGYLGLQMAESLSKLPPHSCASWTLLFVPHTQADP